MPSLLLSANGDEYVKYAARILVRGTDWQVSTFKGNEKKMSSIGIVQVEGDGARLDRASANRIKSLLRHCYFVFAIAVNTNLGRAAMDVGADHFELRNDLKGMQDRLRGNAFSDFVENELPKK